jgi:hypothetical protein
MKAERAATDLKRNSLSRRVNQRNCSLFCPQRAGRQPGGELNKFRAFGPMLPLVAPDAAKRRSGVHYAIRNRRAAL